MIYFNDYLNKHQIDSDGTRAEGCLDKNNIIEFPSCDSFVSRQKVAKYTEMLMKLPISELPKERFSSLDLNSSDDDLQKLAEILIDQEIL